MFRRKDTPSTDPLPFGLRADLSRSGEKLIYRARTFHAPFGKEADTLQRTFLSECRLSVLVFLNRKGALGALDHAVYGAAFPDADIQADVRTLLPRAALRSLGQSFVLARQRGITRASGPELTPTEQATLDALWNIIELALILPGNRGGRDFITGEQARVQTLLTDRFRVSAPARSDVGAPRHPTLTGAERPETPTVAELASPEDSGSRELRTTPLQPEAEAGILAASRPVAEVFDSVRWAEVFDKATVDVEGGKFFMPPQVTALLEQANQRRHTTRLLLTQTASAHFLQSQLHVAEQYQLFLLAAFLSAGQEASLRDLRVLARVMKLSGGFLNLQGWHKIGRQLHEALSLQDIAQFVPESLRSIGQRTEREVAEDFITTVIEETLGLFDVLLALGRDDDGTRAAFRQQVYAAQAARSEQYLPESAARARAQLPPSPSLPTGLLGQVLGERFQQLRGTLTVPARSEEQREAWRNDFARHFQVLFATSVRQAGPVTFGHHSVALLNALSGEGRSASGWQAWHDEALREYALDPFVFRPDYLRELLHAASASATWRSALDVLQKTTRNVIETYVNDLLGGANQEQVAAGFARLQAGIEEHLGPAPTAQGSVVTAPDKDSEPTAAAQSQASPEDSSTLETAPEVEDEPATARTPETAAELSLPTLSTEVPIPRTPVFIETLEDEVWDDEELTPQRPAGPDLGPDFSLELPSHLPSTPKGTDLTLEIDLPVPDLQEPTSTKTSSASSARGQTSHGASHEQDEMETVLRDVSALVGQEDLKRQIHQIANLIRVREMRRASGLPTTDFTPHLALAGKRGTGRTTAAHLLARLYRAAGLLTRGHVVEVLATDLMAGDAPENMEALEQVIKRASGGVLLIDRAYTLTELDSSGGHVVSLFMRLLERHRDDLAVIVAGKQERLEYFQTYNEATRTRFARLVQLTDFTVAELAEVLARFAARQGFRMDHETILAAQQAFTRMAEARQQSISLLEVPPVLESALSRHANRVAGLAQIAPDDLIRLDPADF